MKVFRSNPELRILKLTFHRKTYINTLTMYIGGWIIKVFGVDCMGGSFQDNPEFRILKSSCQAVESHLQNTVLGR